ncbi:uncharacterized protein MONBRDRAFT_38232 [Monosiga brevicollis MX1]|uniref:Eukaryotic translation initiation factor 3 subunit B n=1 Tax=Monosiga brevicollis TaxID=81824 RepID=A9V6L5_MONBE|nr:uncharacterized protein MONBRDRAFT_38232 [Monosiga brevicollis MX1]EDQ86753.1 predicted protein [Monosiga brevicollis MX1]|eukprot:XP_001748298.1 hypothetical protein [Monosiga brevicollis MX1]
MSGPLLTEADAPVLDNSFRNVLVLYGLPDPEASKMAKLEKVIISKVLKDYHIVEHRFLVDEDGKGRGVAFLEFETVEAANTALVALDGYKLDKKHTFQACLLEDMDRILKTEDEFQAPPEEALDSKLNELQSWLLNSDCYDQVALRYQNMTSIGWNMRNRVNIACEREGWSELGVQWSPLGSYLATFHQPGISLWGTEKFERINKFAHMGVKFIDFSPCENYMVTFAPATPINEKDPRSIIIWNLKTGEQMRGFMPPRKYRSAHGEVEEMWPVFKWSHDDKYFARMTDADTLAVYDTESFKKLDNRGIQITGLQEFAWSPRDNVIAYWQPEIAQRPARMGILDIPRKEDLTTRNMFSVVACHLVWQKSGEHVCVHVVRHNKKKTQLYSDFQIFHMNGKDIPCDQLELHRPVVGFFWAPEGNRFAVISGQHPMTRVETYSLESRKIVKHPEHLDITCESVFWSPTSQHMILADRFKMNSQLVFVDANTMETIRIVEHAMVTDIEWDPTGRYVASIASASKTQVDTGYIMWSFQGNQLHKMNRKHFFQLLWRPRPKELINDDDLKEIRRNWKKYQTNFEAADKMMMDQADEETLQARRAMLEDWSDWQMSVEKRLSELRARLKKLRPEDQEDIVEIVETVEVPVKVEEVIVE